KIPLRPHFRFLDNGNSAVLNNNVVWHSKSPQSFRNLIVSLYTHFSEQTFGFTFPQTIGQQIGFFKPLPSGFILLDFILRKPDRPLDRPAPEAVEGGAQKRRCRRLQPLLRG